MYLRIFYILLYVRIPASLLFATQFLGWSLSRRENANFILLFWLSTILATYPPNQESNYLLFAQSNM